MARGRMLNKSISKDVKVAQLVEEVGGLGGLFWTWLIAWLDKHGRAHGDPRILKGEVVPLIDEIDRELITRTIRTAGRLGLIESYSVDGVEYIQFPGFAKNQVGLRADREPDSGIPEPRQSSGNVPEDFRQSSGNVPESIPPKVREGKVRERQQAAEDVPRQTAAVNLGPPRERWSSGPLSSLSDCIDAWEDWRWCVGANVPSNARGAAKRVIRAGPIHPEEWGPAKAKAEAAKKAGHLRPAYFLGVIERSREDEHAAENKTSPPPAQQQPSGAWGNLLTAEVDE